MKTIIYHAISNVHLRNFNIFSSKYDQYNYILLIEHTNIKLNNSLLNKKNVKKIYFSNSENNYNKILNENNKNLVLFLSTSQPRKNIIDLLFWSRINKIPTITYIETFQNFLHVGKLNNYLVPLDKLMVPNNIEYELFKSNNYNLDNINIVNYPFHQISEKKLNKNYNNKKQKKLLILFDASFKHNKLNKFTYKDFDNCFKKIYSKFNKKFKISIKFHPLDEVNFINNSKYIFNKNVSLVRNKDFIDIIENYDFFVFTGHSNAIIESLLRNKKFIIFSINNKNLINNSFKDIIYDEFSIDYFSENKKIDYNYLYNLLFEKNKNLKNVYHIINNLNFDLITNNNYIYYLIWKIYYNNDFSFEMLDNKSKNNRLIKNLFNFDFKISNINKFEELLNSFPINLYLPLLNVIIKKTIKEQNNILDKFYNFINKIPKDIYLIKIFESNILLIYKNIKIKKKFMFKKYLKDNLGIEIKNKFLIKNYISYD